MFTKYLMISVLFVAGLWFITLFTLGYTMPGSSKSKPVEGAEFAQFGLGQIRYQNSGSGHEAILFLHGFNAQLTHWDSVWSLLHECNRALRIDIPGYGQSTWDADSYALPEQGRRVIKFMDDMGIARVTVVGVSMGGSLSAWLIAQYPSRVSSAILLAPSGYTDSLKYKGLFGVLIKPGILNSLATFVVRSKFYRLMFSNSKALHALTVSSSYGARWVPVLKQIQAPVMLLSSVSDMTVPFPYAKAVAREIENSVFISLAEDAGHNIPFTRPELVAKLACQISNGLGVVEIMKDLKNQLASKGDIQLFP